MKKSEKKMKGLNKWCIGKGREGWTGKKRKKYSKSKKRLINSMNSKMMGLSFLNFNRSLKNNKKNNNSK